MIHGPASCRLRPFLPLVVALFLVPVSALASSGESFHRTTLFFLAAVAAAKFFGILCEKLRLPALVGEIAGGVVLGNLALLGAPVDVTGELAGSPFFQYASELGIVLLLFLVGLESNFDELRRVGGNAFLTAAIGVILPTTGGYLVASALGIGDTVTALLYGATFAATSVGITAKLLSEAGKIRAPSAQIILGAAVVDDVMGLVLLAALAGIAGTGSLDAAGLFAILVKVFGFFAIALLLGRLVLPQIFRAYRRVAQPGLLTVLSVFVALAFADAAYLAGLAPIVGAFTAGLLLDDVRLRHAGGVKPVNIEELIKPIMDFFLPVFFVLIGAQVRLETLSTPVNLGLIAILLLVALAGKAVCGFACRGAGLDRIGIGLGMIPRGEVGLIFATFGLQRGIVSSEAYSILVFVVLLTTIIGPVLLKLRVARF